MHRLSHALTISIPEGDPLPGEFRLFRAGANPTTKGEFLFDALAARLVMEAYATHAVDVHIDLEHLALDPECNSYDPDARGWCNLEVRNGELWAVNVRWTPDGERRLKQRTQRYVSPAFCTDEAGRIVDVVNIALTGLPATDSAQPLMAANKTKLKTERLNAMDPELIKKLLDAIEKNDADALKELAKQLVAGAAGGGDPAADSMGDAEALESALAAAPEEKPTEDQKQAMSAALSAISKLTGGKGKKTIAATIVSLRKASAAKASSDPAAVAALAELCKLTGHKSAGEAVATIKSWGERISTLESREAALELDARRELIADLVKLGVELPATAWEGDAKDRKPVKRLAVEPIEELRTRVAQLRKVKPAPIEPPRRTLGDVSRLSDRDLAACKRLNITPEQFAERKENAVRRAS